MTETAGTPNAPWTPTSLLKWTEGFFRDKGIDSPRLDAEILLAHVLSCPRIQLYVQFERPLIADELAKFRELVRARAAHTPVAYLVGTVGFWKLTLAIHPGCLIPRPDTETLVEVTLKAIAALRQQRGADAPVSILELGPGSGAIPLAVCSETQGVAWTAVDASPLALSVARENRTKHTALLEPRSNTLALLRGDRFAAIAPAFRPDLIVSNPPYIPRADIPGLMPEVSQAEPATALDGGPDGMDFHRYLLADAAQRLPPGGRLLMEMAHDQGPRLSAEAAKHKALGRVAIHKDLAGRERVIEVERVG